MEMRIRSRKRGHVLGLIVLGLLAVGARTQGEELQGRRETPSSKDPFRSIPGKAAAETVPLGSAPVGASRDRVGVSDMAGRDVGACCLPPTPYPHPGCESVCIETDELDCEAQDGWFLADTPTCLPDNMNCQLGACCMGPGDCNDNIGDGMDCVDCGDLVGDFIGGARCSDDPCSACPYYPDQAAAHCIFDESSDYMHYIDRSAAEPGEPYPRWADDFIADANGTIERICWWPCFYDPVHEWECHEGPPPGIDDGWQVVFYDDDNYMPGNVIAGPEVLTPDAKAWLGGGWRCWLYTAPVLAGPVVQTGETYWIEITGYGDQEGCQVYWMSNCGGDTPGSSNSYSLRDFDGDWGPEDVVLLTGAGTLCHPWDDCIDLGFCIDVGIQGNLGDVPGACIICNEGVPECDPLLTNHDECRGEWGPTTDPDGVAFFPGQTCATVEVPPAPLGDDCASEAIPLHRPGDLCETLPCTVEFYNTCALTDGPDPVDTCTTPPESNDVPFSADIWYEFYTQAGECGWLTIDACENGTFDAILAVYYDETDTCACPTDSSTMISCGDDTCGDRGGMPLVPPPGEELYVCEDRCYLIRMGGWGGNHGSGEMEISFVPDSANGCALCPGDVVRPMPEDCSTIPPGNRCSDTPTCTTDEDCQNESYCVPPPVGGPPGGICYAPKQRYISIAPNPNQELPTARRVKLSQGSVLGWVGEPYWVPPDPPYHDGLWLADVVDAPHYEETWADVVHVKGCKIGHASLCDPSGVHCNPNECPGGEGCLHHCYWVQAIQDGDDVGNEAKYSQVLELCTPARWADMVGSCDDNVCKPPDGVTGIGDMFAVITKTQGVDVAPLTWVDIHRSNGSREPDQMYGVGELIYAINAFVGEGYPGDGPLTCP